MSEPELTIDIAYRLAPFFAVLTIAIIGTGIGIAIMLYELANQLHAISDVLRARPAQPATIARMEDSHD